MLAVQQSSSDQEPHMSDSIQIRPVVPGDFDAWLPLWDAYNALTFAITHRMNKSNPALAITLGERAWRAATARL